VLVFEQTFEFGGVTMMKTVTPSATGSAGVVGRSALAQARALWRDAVAQPLPADRFRIAHLSALRATAALLAVRSEPGRRLAHRPTSAWVLVLKIAPEFADWAAYFEAGVAKRAAADAGVLAAVSEAEGSEMLEAVRTYLFLVDAAMVNRDTGFDGLLGDSISPTHFPPPTARFTHARAS
jgi:hypothetical protein